jgi:hypothetical protein
LPEQGFHVSESRSVSRLRGQPVSHLDRYGLDASERVRHVGVLGGRPIAANRIRDAVQKLGRVS